MWFFIYIATIKVKRCEVLGRDVKLRDGNESLRFFSKDFSNADDGALYDREIGVKIRASVLRMAFSKHFITSLCEKDPHARPFLPQKRVLGCLATDSGNFVPTPRRKREKKKRIKWRSLKSLHSTSLLYPRIPVLIRIQSLKPSSQSPTNLKDIQISSSIDVQSYVQWNVSKIVAGNLTVYLETSADRSKVGKRMFHHDTITLYDTQWISDRFLISNYREVVQSVGIFLSLSKMWWKIVAGKLTGYLETSADRSKVGKRIFYRGTLIRYDTQLN